MTAGAAGAALCSSARPRRSTPHVVVHNRGLKARVVPDLSHRGRVPTADGPGVDSSAGRRPAATGVSARLFRQVRRQEGLSQRQLAERSGVSLSTIARVESGSTESSVAVLSAVLAAGGLELNADPALAPPPPALVRHLQRSLPERLVLLLGGGGALVAPFAPRWREFLDAARTGPLLLVGAAAAGLWIPLPPPAQVTVLRRHRPVPAGGRPLPPLPPLAPWLEVVDVDAHPAGIVGLAVGYPPVATLSPLSLADDPACAADRRLLRTAARVLHDSPVRDLAGRRAMAHREPRHDVEAERSRRTRRYGARPDPGLKGLRSWRLDAPVSRRQQLREAGFPD